MLLPPCSGRGLGLFAPRSVLLRSQYILYSFARKPCAASKIPSPLAWDIDALAPASSALAGYASRSHPGRSHGPVFSVVRCHCSFATPSAGKHGVACAKHSPGGARPSGDGEAIWHTAALAFLAPHPIFQALIEQSS